MYLNDNYYFYRKIRADQIFKVFLIYYTHYIIFYIINPGFIFKIDRVIVVLNLKDFSR